MKNDELPEAAAKRVCKEKLNCSAVSVRFVGAMYQKRNKYDICLMDIEMQLVGEPQSDVLSATSSDTVYAAQKWSIDPLDIMSSAKKVHAAAAYF